ncbi:MAG: YggT family protein [Blastocatellales bacterium]
MEQDKTLMLDDERRLEQYESVKDSARSEIQSRVKQQADHLEPGEKAEVASLGDEFKQKAISEIRSTDSELKRARVVARFSQVTDYLFYLIYGLITLQIIFDLFGARRSNGFRNFIDVISSPWLAPFKNLFPDPAAGRFQIRFSYIAALLIYVLLHAAINGLFRMIAHRKPAV